MAQQFQPNASVKVKVQPKASSNQVAGYRGDILRLRVTAPPEGGKANEAVVSLLAETLGIAKSRVRIARGRASKEKLVVVESLSREELERRLKGQPGSPGKAIHKYLQDESVGEIPSPGWGKARMGVKILGVIFPHLNPLPWRERRLEAITQTIKSFALY